MAKAQIQHTYECDVDTFWSDILLDPEFNHRLFIEHLEFKQWEVARYREDDDCIEREIVIRPLAADLPKAMSRLVGENLGFREEGRFDKKTKRYTFRVIPNRLSDKLRIEGEIYVEARGDGRCERFVDLDIEAKVFGLGTIIENRILADTRESYDRGYVFAKKFLADRSAS